MRSIRNGVIKRGLSRSPSSSLLTAVLCLLGICVMDTIDKGGGWKKVIKWFLIVILCYLFLVFLNLK
ncbi:MAG: hypothetical protein A3C43_06960 [Candidatus Schekmanbacteria bacterium RIFCSPHIGHO2_02_FULL_38_11]|uniref:Uncharacterized protein n=1 Tax=Candidatus Schekmanbacteria bacterium RIFCSPLOWO2_12_FULL_38_15 TaxID=1817883 RepID=A0A1F7SFI9_9BACT|nr:MAG: hypothetical protein A2043_06060 [Candidatus Schekmanbacteria bacterium GWA2_38_9]OGL49797.1 MAG: hypothetical protein A3C43_06960 [Candidatus Schekmanbacteria bacterium RIFCSPHIGHO2_02_FULL_38_11]OGL52501.1 MAG: hypothetical protein A3G31_10970 [Candidatus Schekmanbacteria bacterium RIFCSPLOWO2_12_FULL_38_15]